MEAAKSAPSEQKRKQKRTEVPNAYEGHEGRTPSDEKGYCVAD
jgi:hypothetical protein